MRRVMAYVATHALPIALLLVLAVTLYDCSRKADDLDVARAYQDSAAVYRGQKQALERDTARLNREREAAAAHTDSALAVIDSLQEAGVRTVTRWMTLPDTASAAEVRAVADSVIKHLTDVGTQWKEAFLARSHELEIAQAQIRNLTSQLQASDGQIRSLEAANRELMAVADRRPSALIPVAFVGGGTAIGASLRGLEGAAEGAAAGLGVTVVYFGVKELLRVRLPSLSEILWPF